MNAGQAVMWLLGIALILGGVYLFYFEANLARWFSVTLLGAGVLLFLGLVVLMFAGGRSDDSHTTVVNEDTTTGARDVTTTSVRHD